jgi:hypothetical protein
MKYNNIVFVMMNIHEELKVLVVRSGTSIAKTLRKMKENGYKVPSPSNFSNKFKKETAKFKEVQEMLDFLGYKLEIMKK